MITSKKCSKCGLAKGFSDFYKRNDRPSGLGVLSVCKKCSLKANREYYRTKNGLLAAIYSSQKKHSKRRGDAPPNYTKSAFVEWVLNQDVFHVLHNKWGNGGFKKSDVPSVDRLDDYAPYSLGNIQLLTWEQNKRKYETGKIKGINRKQLKSVSQMNIDGLFIKNYYSIAQAERETGVNDSDIVSCCKGRLKKAGGFRWMYSDKCDSSGNCAWILVGC